MRALVTTGAGQLGWRAVPEPELPAEGALVRPLAVARCDLDPPMLALGLWQGSFTVGHETVAEVVAVGEQAPAALVGTRVLVPFQLSCGTCRHCIAGRTAACATYRSPAGAAFGFGADGGDFGGAVADLLAVPHAQHLLLPAPDGVPVEQLATLPDNVVDGYRAVAPQLLDEPAADVLVLGAQARAVGLYAVAMARALGAAVRYVDDDDARLRVAEGLGATPVEATGALPRRFERARIVVENTGTPEGLACALRSTDDEGTCTSVAIHFTDPTVPVIEAYTRGLTYRTGRADSRRHLPAVLKLLAAGRYDPAAVPLTTVAWDDAAQAWPDPDVLKMVLVR